jgi:hypothetical protein
MNYPSRYPTEWPRVQDQWSCRSPCVHGAESCQGIARRDRGVPIQIILFLLKPTWCRILSRNCSQRSWCAYLNNFILASTENIRKPYCSAKHRLSNRGHQIPPPARRDLWRLGRRRPAIFPGGSGSRRGSLCPSQLWGIAVSASPDEFGLKFVVALYEEICKCRERYYKFWIFIFSGMR